MCDLGICCQIWVYTICNKGVLNGQEVSTGDNIYGKFKLRIQTIIVEPDQVAPMSLESSLIWVHNVCNKDLKWTSSRPRGCGFEPHRRHCVVVLEQDTFILA